MAALDPAIQNVWRKRSFIKRDASRLTRKAAFWACVFRNAELIPAARLWGLRPVRICKPCHTKGGFETVLATFRKCIRYPSAVKQNALGRLLQVAAYRASEDDERHGNP